jgi:hypothetical protein
VVVVGVVVVEALGMVNTPVSIVAIPPGRG